MRINDIHFWWLIIALETNQDMIKHGFYYATDQEIVFLARQSKLEPSKFKLVRTQYSTLVQGKCDFSNFWILFRYDQKYSLQINKNRFR